MTTTLADLLGPEAAPVTFAHEGETYSVTPITLEVETRIARHLRAAAYADLYAERDLMPPDQYEDALAVLQRDRARYAYLGREFWKTLGSDRGMTALLAILLGTTEPKAAKLLKDRGPDVTALVMETILASLPRERAEAVRKALREKGGAVPAAPNGAAAENPPLPPAP